MGAVDTTYTFTATDTITSAKMNNIIDQTTITNDAILGTTLEVVSGKLKVRSQGITSNELSSDLASLLFPAGAIMAFAMNSAPSGWLEANGASISTIGVNAALFAAIGYTYGGSGSSFNLPDLRGIFIRGSGSQTISGTTYSGTFAGKQNDELKGHTHTVTDVDVANSVGRGSGSTSTAFVGTSTTRTTSSTGGTETRPANVALLYCIKL